MNKIFGILIVSIFIVGCKGLPQEKAFHSSKCNKGVDGYTVTAVHYGDGRIIVIPITIVRANYELQFLLVPKIRDKTDPPNGYKTFDVEITGTGAAASWLGSTKSFNSSNRGLMSGGCVPDNAIVGTMYKYNIVVPGIGRLDPRAEVVN